MKAIVLNRYGPPEALSYQEVERPVPGEHEALVEVHASAANDWELGLMRGKPLFMRSFVGVFRPKVRIMGCDVAGRVEAVGPKVTRFTEGDEVYGDLSGAGFGAFAEYVCAPERALERKPSNVTFEEAATIPHAAGLALQGLRDIGQLRDGQRLLINGAGGGVGTIGIQYSKLLRTEVTGVDSGLKLDFMRSLGCDHVIDYEKEDFTESPPRYDLILDAKTTRSPSRYARALRDGGTYVTVGGSMSRVFQVMLLAPWFARAGNKRLRVLGLKPNEGLADVTEWVEEGKIVPSIGVRYSLSEVPAALRAYEQSRHTGRIVISVHE